MFESRVLLREVTGSKDEEDLPVTNLLFVPFIK
jgi:hypothetical protein